MADARATILEGIRSALRDVAPADIAADYAAIRRTYIRAGQFDLEARLHLLKERLRDYDTNVVETHPASLPRTIAEVLRSHSQKNVIAADGLPPEILPSDFPFISERNASVDTLNACDGIVTACSVAIAFTGTIVPVSYTHLDVYKRQRRASSRLEPAVMQPGKSGKLTP